MKSHTFFILFALAGVALAVPAQDASQVNEDAFGRVAESVQQRLAKSIVELSQLREQAARETIPLSRKLSDLESELEKVRRDYQQTTRLLDSRTLDLSNLRTEIQSRQEESTYLSNLLGEYVRNFESRLHISEIERYRESLETAKLAAENSHLSRQEVYEAQAELLQASIERLNDALGGTRFEGAAVDPNGAVKQGAFVLVGPSALFQSNDGELIGTAEQRLGSLEPAIVPFGDVADAEAAEQFMSGVGGAFLFDPTLGNAHKIEDTQETFIEHVKKGGIVMYPIFAMAGAAFLVALFKWFGMLFIRKPSPKRIKALLDAVAAHDKKAVKEKAKAIQGPVGEMLQAGAAHIKEPREFIEEVMYEKVLSARLKLERFLPFIAISAASAPLLGLLGTVTGIINTFKLITVFGSGDVKTLSGGISEALITTEFGLIVAIPSLLIHAFLSRKARNIVNQMEKSGVALINQISKIPYDSNWIEERDDPAAEKKTGRVESVESMEHPSEDEPASAPKNSPVFRINRNATAAQAIREIRRAQIHGDIDSIYVVDEYGELVGNLPVGSLLTCPEHAILESLIDGKSHVDRDGKPQCQMEVPSSQPELVSMSVLDDDDSYAPQFSSSGNGDSIGNASRNES